MMRWSLICGLAAFLAVGAWAQGAGRGDNWRDLLNRTDTGAAVAASATAVEVTEKGIFAMRGGVMAKLDAKTLEEKGVLELFGPMPERPVNNDREANTRYRAERDKRRQSAVWLFAEADIIVVMADTFFRIDAEKLEVKAKADLADPEAKPNPNANPLGFLTTPPAPVLKLADKTLFIVQDTKITSVDIAEGKVLARGQLPAALVGTQPARPNPAPRPNPNPTPNPAPTPGVEATVVGAMTNHPELEGGFWTVRQDNGDEYVLAGAMLEKLLATPNIEGKRVRLTGKLSTRAGIAMFGKGYFDVAAFQVLPDPVAE